MPTYHIPTFRTVVGRAVERTWLFLKKIVTIVAAVSVIIFALLQYPGLSQDKMQTYQAQWDKAVTAFEKQIGENNTYAAALHGEGLAKYLLFADEYKQARTGVTDQTKSTAIFEEFRKINPTFAALLKPEKTSVATPRPRNIWQPMEKTIHFHEPDCSLTIIDVAMHGGYKAMNNIRAKACRGVNPVLESCILESKD
eukprot:TRINITY_DN26347_c0_g1_i1.p1 TRINITY_DN26347_c0_g1~~TRINITY_DN26347_c0_g1_i1.p1  ORF type:complete len:197 (-),score=18.55 TRINITY_DN26347_c0_g1_i1:70-660(-)